MWSGMYTGSGFIIAAVVQAENAVLSVIFFLAGELFLVVYCFLYQKFTKFDDREVRNHCEIVELFLVRQRQPPLQ